MVTINRHASWIKRRRRRISKDAQQQKQQRTNTVARFYACTPPSSEKLINNCIESVFYYDLLHRTRCSTYYIPREFARWAPSNNKHRRRTTARCTASLLLLLLQRAQCTMHSARLRKMRVRNAKALNHRRGSVCSALRRDSTAASAGIQISTRRERIYLRDSRPAAEHAALESIMRLAFLCVYVCCRAAQKKQRSAFSDNDNDSDNDGVGDAR